MSDLRDPAEARESGEEKSFLLERGWQDHERDSLEAKDLVNGQGYFEGASSMIELPNQLPSIPGEQP